MSAISCPPWPFGSGERTRYPLTLVCFLAARLFPITWARLVSAVFDEAAGLSQSIGEGVIWNVVFAWIAAALFGTSYKWLALN
jgi:hypothetical protein